LAVDITQEKNRMPLPGTRGSPVFGGADITTVIKVYDGLFSCIATIPAAGDVHTMFPYYCSETIQEMVKMSHGYPMKDWVHLEEKLKDAF
jgi:hypothetical protein